MPAFITSASGKVKHANQAARERLENSPSLVQAAIRAALRGDASDFEATPLAVRGAPPHFLLCQRRERDLLTARLEEARIAWRLTARQAHVLERLALGDANKDIAVRFRMSTRTVEQHVADLIRKAGADSRLRLVARFWSGRDDIGRGVRSEATE